MGPLGYAMPVNYEAVYDVLTDEGLIFKRDTDRRKEQARRVAWRILKDWIEAQIALLESGMVEMEEIFLPYMLAGAGDRDPLQSVSRWAVSGPALNHERRHSTTASEEPRASVTAWDPLEKKQNDRGSQNHV